MYADSVFYLLIFVDNFDETLGSRSGVGSPREGKNIFERGLYPQTQGCSSFKVLSKTGAEVDIFPKSLLLKQFSGKGKGTPLLKNGIHCSGKFADPDESDVNSDFQGFK